MRPMRIASNVLLLGLAAHFGSALAQSTVPAGTQFIVEMSKTLEAKKAKPGKKFEARTVEALRTPGGGEIQAGAKLKGRVSHARHDSLILRFEQIETGRGKQPIVATVMRVVGERDVRDPAGKEGEIRAESRRGRDAAIGAAIVGGLGAAIGGARGGGKGAAIGGGAGAAAGAAMGAAAGGGDLVLRQGARLELLLDRPLSFR